MCMKNQLIDEFIIHNKPYAVQKTSCQFYRNYPKGDKLRFACGGFLKTIGSYENQNNLQLCKNIIKQRVI